MGHLHALPHCTAVSSELTLATLERHLSLSSARRTTSPAVLHLTNIFLPSMYFKLCLPPALVHASTPSEQYFSRLVPFSVCPRCPSCLLPIVVISCLEVPDISNTAKLFLFANQGTMSILLMNHISKASKFYFLSKLIVKHSHS